MPLVTSKEILQRALAEHFAVGAFNANNMEQVQAIVEAAQEERAPVILQVSQGAIRYAGLTFAAGMVKIAASMVDVPVVLHLDHGTDFDQNVLCLREGFTSLMFDGSKLPFEENVAVAASYRWGECRGGGGGDDRSRPGTGVCPAHRCRFAGRGCWISARHDGPPGHAGH